MRNGPLRICKLLIIFVVKLYHDLTISYGESFHLGVIILQIISELFQCIISPTYLFLTFR